MKTVNKIHYLRTILNNTVINLNNLSLKQYSIKESISSTNIFIKITYNNKVVVSVDEENMSLYLVLDRLELLIVQLLSGELIYRSNILKESSITKHIGKW